MYMYVLDMLCILCLGNRQNVVTEQRKSLLQFPVNTEGARVSSAASLSENSVFLVVFSVVSWCRQGALWRSLIGGW